VIVAVMLALLAVSVTAAEMEAEKHAPAYRHAEEDETEGEEENAEEGGEEANEEADSLVEAKATKSEAATDSDLVQQLFKLVKAGSETDKKLAADLSEEAAQSAALQTDLSVKQQKLQRHQNLMKNLQICLAQGPEALSQTPTAMSALETKAKAETDAEGSCDCIALRQKLADAKMELENANTEEGAYKKQYEKAAALLQAAQKKLNRIRLAEKQPTQSTLCDKLTTCSACGAVDGCAWCGSSLGFGGIDKGAGMCRRMDVNARLRGHPSMDGLTSGECEAKSWQTKVSSRISALSFNVFAADLHHARRRARQVFRTIKRAGYPTFIAFQEVEDWFLQALKLESWTQTYYQSDFGSGHAPGGLYILSKFPLSKVAYSEQTAPGQVQYDQRARVLIVNAVINQTPPPPPPKAGAASKVTPSAGSFVVTVASTALDWRAVDSRTDGIDFVMASLSPFNDVILMGDFNFDHGAQPETAHIPENWLDVWPALNPENLGHTWDPDTNAYARASDPTSRPSRVDRILVKSVHWLPRYIKLVGCSSVDLMCQSLYAAPQVAKRPHALPQPLSQPHASTEANSPPLPALAKPKKAADAVFLEVESGEEATADSDAEGVPIIPSNHYGLLAHFSRFEAHC
jgi:endonuclease/exonuclease/phosphatase family metal-dependent hydrolase